ncbi:MAG: hypothetical protein KGI24_07655 [Candidatus Omnitrophica bacterium]|nr:hypothetical protein [Candidatus Omnitrophota bacterium]
MFKKFALGVMLVLSLTSFAMADYPSDVTILNRADIAKLSDDQLVDAYENTVVELDASKLFHTTSGFSPKEYKDYKDLLKYRLELLVEIHNRNLELPQF